jgi:hypothetical protein
MRRTLIGSTVLLAAALALTGCSVGASGGGSAGDYSVPQEAQAPGIAEGDSAGVALDSNGSTSAIADRQVIISGNVTITADDPITASRDAVRIVEAAGGRVDGRTEYAPTETDQGSATLQLRIPADKLTATLDKLEELGRADEVSLSTSDVTVESQDLDARISALRSSIERLNGLMAQAVNIDDLITLETAISSRQGELESLEAQQRYLADQVSMSTISLYLRSDAEAPKTVPGDFWSGLATGWNAFVAFWAGLLVVIGVLLPWLITLAAIAALIIWIVRRRRRPAPASGAAPQPSERSSASKAKP